MQYIILENKEIVLIDFNYFFKNHISIKIVNELHDYLILGKLDNNTKRLICHNIITEICNLLLSISSKYKKIITINKHTFNSPLTNWYDDPDDKIQINNSIFNCLNNITKNLPIPIIDLHNNVHFNEFDDNNFWETGDGKELLANIQNIKQLDYSKYTFKKMQKYTKTMGLKTINEQFLNSLKSRQLLY